MLFEKHQLLRMATVVTVLLVFQHSEAKEVKIKHGDLTLNANLNLAPGKSLADGIVLMLHGTLAHKNMEFMRGLQDALVERSISNLAFNLSLARNNRHGMFDCAGPHQHKDTNAVKEVGLWVDWLKAEGSGAITVLGHSRGGNQVARYVADMPEAAIKRTVLISPGTWEPEKLTRNYKKNYKKDLVPLLEKARALVKAKRGDNLMEGVDILYCPNTVVAANTFIDYYKELPYLDTPSVIKQIKSPVLAVVGDNDQVVPKFLEKMMGTKQANVQFVVVEDAGHFFLDLFGEDLADLIASFVNAENS
jgi:pimeloyl-ACP methyl ester carboxylesterase